MLSAASSSRLSYFLTNAHCTSQFGSSTGQSAGQPTLNPPTDVIGSEVSDPPTFTGGACPSEKVCRYSDAALFKYTNGAFPTFPAVAYPSVGSTSYTQTKWVGGTVAPYVGLVIHRVGQVSGHQTGTITATCAHFNILGTNRRLLCQMEATGNTPMEGDSGSPVVMSCLGHRRHFSLRGSR